MKNKEFSKRGILELFKKPNYIFLLLKRNHNFVLNNCSIKNV